MPSFFKWWIASERSKELDESVVSFYESGRAKAGINTARSQALPRDVCIESFKPLRRFKVMRCRTIILYESQIMPFLSVADFCQNQDVEWELATRCHCPTIPQMPRASLAFILPFLDQASRTASPLPVSLTHFAAVNGRLRAVSVFQDLICRTVSDWTFHVAESWTRDFTCESKTVATTMSYDCWRTNRRNVVIYIPRLAPSLNSQAFHPFSGNYRGCNQDLWFATTTTTIP